MTDTRTNEQIVAEAMADAGAPLMHSRVEEAVVAALRTAGRLQDAATIREAKAEALEEFAEQMTSGFNSDTLNAERRAIKREARTRAAEIRAKGEQ